MVPTGENVSYRCELVLQVRISHTGENANKPYCYIKVFRIVYW